MENSATTEWRPGPATRVRHALEGIRDWLDERGRPAWFATMIVGFIFVWPVGLAILIYMIGSNRMGCKNRRYSKHKTKFGSSGNTAFDAYREATMKRLEEEHEQFTAFMTRLREARDKAEFDQFMTERRAAPQTPTPTDDRPVQL